jgi:hypothetical protein
LSFEKKISTTSDDIEKKADDSGLKKKVGDKVGSIATFFQTKVRKLTGKDK